MAFTRCGPSSWVVVMSMNDPVKGLTMGRPREANPNIPVRKRPLVDALKTVLDTAGLTNEQVAAQATPKMMKSTFARHLRGEGREQPDDAIIRLVVTTAARAEGISIETLIARHPELAQRWAGIPVGPDAATDASSGSSATALSGTARWEQMTWVLEQRKASDTWGPTENEDRLMGLILEGREFEAVTSARTWFDDDAELAAALVMIGRHDPGGVAAFLHAVADVDGPERWSVVSDAIHAIDSTLLTAVREVPRSAHKRPLRIKWAQEDPVVMGATVVGHRLAATVSRGDGGQAALELMAVVSRTTEGNELDGRRAAALVLEMTHAEPDGPRSAGVAVREVFARDDEAATAIVWELFNDRFFRRDLTEFVRHLDDITAFECLSSWFQTAKDEAAVGDTEWRVRRFVADSRPEQIARIFLLLLDESRRGRTTAGRRAAYLAQFLTVSGPRGGQRRSGIDGAGAVISELLLREERAKGVLELIARGARSTHAGTSEEDVWQGIAAGWRRALHTDFLPANRVFGDFVSTDRMVGHVLLTQVWSSDAKIEQGAVKRDLIHWGWFLDRYGSPFAAAMASGVGRARWGHRDRQIVTGLLTFSSEFARRVLTVLGEGHPSQLGNVLIELLDESPELTSTAARLMYRDGGAPLWGTVIERLQEVDDRAGRQAIWRAVRGGEG